MRKLITCLMIISLSAPLAGCLVRTGPQHSHRHQHVRGNKSCPPAHHWNGARCVHNGRGHAHGHRK
jgi:hypothetical protein